MYSDIPVFPATYYVLIIFIYLFQTQTSYFPLWNTKVEWGLYKKALCTMFSAIIRYIYEEQAKRKSFTGKLSCNEQLIVDLFEGLN